MGIFDLKEYLPRSFRNKFSHSTKIKIRRFFVTLEIVLSFKHGSWNYFLGSISSLFKLNKALGFPVTVTIEPTSACDQKCPICETGNNTLNRKKEFLSLEKYKIIIDQIHKHTNRIMLYFMGETFLNRDAYEMIKYARSKKIWVETCTNANYLNPEKLINSGINEVDFQISGMTQESHETYRVGGNLETALKSLEETIKIRNKRKAKTRIVVGYIVMKHNEHEIVTLIDYCNKIGVDKINIIKPAVRTPEEAGKFIPEDEKWWIYNKSVYDKEKKLVPKNIPNNYCDWLYFGVNIYVNGDIVPCCRDVSGKYVMGNIFNEPFAKIWNNKKFRNFRKKILNEQNKVPICRLCEGYERVNLV